MSNKFYRRGEFSAAMERKIDCEYKDIISYASNPCNGMDVQLRGNYINVYYKGGNILRIKPQSFEFDMFYFYLDCQKDNRGTRKSVILDASKGKEDAIKDICRDDAVSIIAGLQKSRDELMQYVLTPNIYFPKAKIVIDRWLTNLEQKLDITHNEKETQHNISLYNRDFSSSDLVVVDLEYAISQKSSFSEKGGNPRPDIIAIDHYGRIHVLELKYKFKATEGDAGVDVHISDFEKTIAKDLKGEFRQEIKNLVEKKKELGLLKITQKVDDSLKPVFDLVFMGSKRDSTIFENSYGHYKIENKVNEIFYLNDCNYYIRK